MKKILLYFSLLLLLTACFWKYSPRPGTIPPHIKSVAIDETVNNTAEFNLGQEFTIILNDRMRRDNLLPLSDPSVSHSVILTTIRDIRDDVATYDEAEVVKEYRLSLRLDFRWYDAVNALDMMEDSFSDYVVYYSDQYNNTLSAADQIKREDAMAALLDKLAEKVLIKLTSDW